MMCLGSSPLKIWIPHTLLKQKVSEDEDTTETSVSCLCSGTHVTLTFGLRAWFTVVTWEESTCTSVKNVCKQRPCWFWAGVHQDKPCTKFWKCLRVSLFVCTCSDNWLKMVPPTFFITKTRVPEVSKQVSRFKGKSHYTPYVPFFCEIDLGKYNVMSDFGLIMENVAKSRRTFAIASPFSGIRLRRILSRSYTWRVHVYSRWRRTSYTTASSCRQRTSCDMQRTRESKSNSSRTPAVLLLLKPLSVAASETTRSCQKRWVETGECQHIACCSQVDTTV